MDRGAWWATIHGVTESQTRLSMYTQNTQWQTRNEKEPNVRSLKTLYPNEEVDMHVNNVRVFTCC